MLSDGRYDRRKNGHHVLIAPPFILQQSQADELMDKFTLALDDTFKALGG
ncbi:hypothetical protein [Aliamphritea spongicola]|nr:hypothetical protein [Aliamphritea spongicola]